MHTKNCPWGKSSSILTPSHFGTFTRLAYLPRITYSVWHVCITMIFTSISPCTSLSSFSVNFLSGGNTHLNLGTFSYPYFGKGLSANPFSFHGLVISLKGLKQLHYFCPPVLPHTQLSSPPKLGWSFWKTLSETQNLSSLPLCSLKMLILAV